MNINDASRIENVSMLNSTFYKVDGVIASASAANTVTISDCTFNEAPLGNNKNYYFDYGSNAVTNGVNISNCIFGTGKVSGSSTTVKEVRAGSGTVIGMTNNYKTADHVIVR